LPSIVIAAARLEISPICRAEFTPILKIEAPSHATYTKRTDQKYLIVERLNIYVSESENMDIVSEAKTQERR
jgi:hypothetical protein